MMLVILCGSSRPTYSLSASFVVSVATGTTVHCKYSTLMHTSHFANMSDPRVDGDIDHRSNPGSVADLDSFICAGCLRSKPSRRRLDNCLACKSRLEFERATLVFHSGGWCVEKHHGYSVKFVSVVHLHNRI
jgi:hypothetical protein